MDRRRFLRTAAATSAGTVGALTATGTAHAAAPSAPSAPPTLSAPSAPAAHGAAAPRLTWTVFSRHLQWLTTQAHAWSHPKDTGALIGETAAGLGFAAVDLTVRSGGHVEPAQVGTALAPMLAGIRGAGVECDQITTDIATAAGPYAEQVLAAAAGSGVRLFRWSSLAYPPGAPAFGTAAVRRRIASVRAEVAAVAALADRHHLVGIYHPFSGGAVGSALWDLVDLLAPYSPHSLGINYATEHMFAEGAVSAWKFNLQAAAPQVLGVALADMTLVRGAAGGASESGAFPGTGLVDFAALFTLLRQAGFRGPVEVLTEYVHQGVNLNSTFWADSPGFTLTPAQMRATLADALAAYRSFATAGGWTAAEQRA
ncbi:hypothetical protein RVR_1698 [Actinacidiphila reveromycinica]|uniref:Xylose isomerase-like TIM barrel domain-containing protein n=1 Tax=Actinacidiphila reveromycinica TaxID=659352 RepID=A0A7U3VMB7_9ACTN|nr:TIM barrel protein [Streptomyces sp. SN-593]BBA96414.1 hypothetical protein RVR_1698 [Streptomyces sp. SN-593]